MLNAMREGAKSGIMKFILFGFMVLAVGGLVLMDVGGVFRGGVTSTSVAKIDGNELSIIRFDRMLRRILANQGLDVETAYKLGFINQVLAGEVNNNLIQRAAADMGLQVGDQAVLKQVNSLVEPFLTDEIDRRTALQRILQMQGMSEAEFIGMIKAQMTNTLLTNTIQIGTNVPPAGEAADIYQYRNEQRTVKTVFLPHSGIKEVDEPAEENLLSFYQAGQEKYAIPETRSFTVAILDHEQLQKTMDVSEEELRSIYDRDIDTYTLPERRVLEQVIIDNQATATGIVNRVKDGASLKAAVKSETESEDAYLGAETFEQQGLLEDISGPVFEAQKGDIVGPLESALGWHVFVVSDILEPSVKPFEDVKAGLRKELLETRLMDEMYAAAAAIDDALAGGSSLEDVAKNMGLSTKQYGPVKADGSTQDNKDGVKDFDADAAYITEIVFDLGEGETSPVTELADGRYAAIRVNAINEKSYKPFEEVKEDLRKTWIQDQKEVANKLRTEDAQRALTMGEADLEKIAADNGATVKTYKLVRSEDAPAPLNNQARNMFFYLEQGKSGAATADGGFIIGQVESITLPDTAKLEQEEVAPVMQVVQQSNQQEFMEFYMRRLHNSYDVKINQRLIDSTYGPAAGF